MLQEDSRTSWALVPTFLSAHIQFGHLFAIIHFSHVWPWVLSGFCCLSVMFCLGGCGHEEESLADRTNRSHSSVY